LTKVTFNCELGYMRHARSTERISSE